MRSETELSQFLCIFLPTFTKKKINLRKPILVTLNLYSRLFSFLLRKSGSNELYYVTLTLANIEFHDRL